MGYRPRAVLLSPNLEKRDGAYPHHIYGVDKAGHAILCVYCPDKGEWSSDMPIAKSFIPWVSTWLNTYEYWLITGEWHYDEIINHTDIKEQVCDYMTPEVKERIEQIRRGNVPEGYRKTKAGILPADWKACTFDECLERVERPVDVQADALYTQIGIRSHGKGLFHKEPVTGESLGNKAVYWIEPDCFILNIVFAWEQAIGKTTQAEVGMIGSHRIPMYCPIDRKVDIDYLISYLSVS